MNHVSGSSRCSCWRLLGIFLLLIVLCSRHSSSGRTTTAQLDFGVLGLSLDSRKSPIQNAFRVPSRRTRRRASCLSAKKEPAAANKGDHADHRKRKVLPPLPSSTTHRRVYLPILDKLQQGHDYHHHHYYLCYDIYELLSSSQGSSSSSSPLLREKDPMAPFRFMLFLHGGPGAGCTENHARFFPPSANNCTTTVVVLLHQRGSKLSSSNNTSSPFFEKQKLLDLARDCEQVRIDVVQRYTGSTTPTTGSNIPWTTVLGGSWGSALALAYAQEFPQSVQSLVLRGICTLRPCEVDWLWSGGSNADIPAAALSLSSACQNRWKQLKSFMNVTDQDETQNPRAVLEAFYDCLCCRQICPSVFQDAISAWMGWEFLVGTASRKNPDDQITNLPNGTLVWGSDTLTLLELQSLDAIRRGLVETETEVQLEPHKSSSLFTFIHELDQSERMPMSPILTCYYSVNDNYCMNNVRLLDPERMGRIRHIPCIGVHGGQDNICPIDTALELKLQYGSNMELRVPWNGGHSMYDDDICSGILSAMDDIQQKI